MAIGFLGILILTILCGGMIAVPISRGFLVGLASAREPVHRVTPENPRVFFRRAYRRETRRANIVLILILITVFSLGCLPILFNNVPTGFGVILGLDLVAMLLTVTLSIFTVALLIAPRCEQAWPVAALGVLLGFGLVFLGLLLPGKWFPREWHTLTFQQTQSAGGIVSYDTSILPIYVLVFTGLVTLLIWQIALARGEKWFRFDS